MMDGQMDEARVLLHATRRYSQMATRNSSTWCHAISWVPQSEKQDLRCAIEQMDRLPRSRVNAWASLAVLHEWEVPFTKHATSFFSLSILTCGGWSGWVLVGYISWFPPLPLIRSFLCILGTTARVIFDSVISNSHSYERPNRRCWVCTIPKTYDLREPELVRESSRSFVEPLLNLKILPLVDAICNKDDLAC